MNSNQNGAVLVKFNLVIRLVISLNYTPDWLQTFNVMQFVHVFRCLFILVLALRFM
jgi:hypothetical protein